MAHRTVVSSKGQVVIPAELREQLGLKKGTLATWTEENGRLVLTPIASKLLDEIRGYLKPLPGEASAFEGCFEERARERAREKKLAPDSSASQVCIGCECADRLFRRPAGNRQKVEHVFEEALHNDTPVLMSAVTWGEVFYVEWRYRGEDNAYRAEGRARQLPLTIISVDQERATRAGAIKQRHGLGYADSFAAELAMERSAWLVTADREFEKLGRHLFTLLLPRR